MVRDIIASDQQHFRDVILAVYPTQKFHENMFRIVFCNSAENPINQQINKPTNTLTQVKK